MIRAATRRFARLLVIVMIATAAPQAMAEADFSGVWRVIGGGAGGGDAFEGNPESEWSREALPFTPEGRAAFDANRPGKGPRLLHNPAERNDPLVGGNPPGLYRTLVYSRPTEFVHMPGKVIQLFEWSRAWRPIYTDGRDVPDDMPTGPFWYGYSVGHWEGDTLVVTTISVDSRAWFDEWGTPITDDARIEERWRRTGPETLQLQITVNDPATYTRPWTSMPILLALQKKGTDVGEVIHTPIDELEFERLIINPASGR